MDDQSDKSDRVKRACVEEEGDLRAFLLGMLKDLHSVEDVFQRTVVRAMESAESVRIETLRGWLFKIALNEARAEKRKASYEHRKNLGLIEEIKGSAESGSGSEGLSQILGSEQKQALIDAVERLPPQQREVIRRRIEEDQKFVEIADQMGRPLGTILTWMRRALAALKDMPSVRDLKSEQD